MFVLPSVETVLVQMLLTYRQLILRLHLENRGFSLLFRRGVSSEMDTSTRTCSDGEKPAKETLGTICEGKVEVLHDPKNPIFYNPAQEINRDLSILAIQTFIKGFKEEKKTKEGKISILEAMAASGMRSIRYAKEIKGVDNIIANDFSEVAVESIRRNSEHNGTSDIIQPSCMDACALMYSKKNMCTIVDVDPYGTPVPFLDAAVQSVQDGGMLLVTATDMAILAGNHPETCFAKYGCMSLKSSACHEMALRIVIFAVQTAANRYGRFVEPLLSLSIDFYVRLFFRVTKSPITCKESAAQTGLVYQCTGCKSLNLQPLAVKRSNGIALANGPTVPQKCEFCNFQFHIGGPMWVGQLHDKLFIARMLETLEETHEYLNTSVRIRGLISVAGEEVETPLFYEISQLCSVLKSSVVKLLKFRSALIALGYQVSVSHVGPNTLKTNAPNNVIWDVLREWHRVGDGGKPKEGTPGHAILAKYSETKGISFEVREDANPPSREKGFLRFQMNPTKFWGPGMRDNFKVHHSETIDKKIQNQGKRGKRKRTSEHMDPGSKNASQEIIIKSDSSPEG